MFYLNITGRPFIILPLKAIIINSICKIFINRNWFKLSIIKQSILIKINNIINPRRLFFRQIILGIRFKQIFLQILFKLNSMSFYKLIFQRLQQINKARFLQRHVRNELHSTFISTQFLFTFISLQLINFIAYCRFRSFLPLNILN